MVKAVKDAAMEIKLSSAQYIVAPEESPASFMLAPIPRLSALLR